MKPTDPLVEVRGVSKHFGGARALDEVSIAIEKGTIHGLVGENGAGKSTLGKIIAGLISPDSGTIEVSGEAVSMSSPRDALRLGITAITQEVTLVPRRTILENVFLGRERSRAGMVDDRGLRDRYDGLLTETGFALAPDTIVGTLRVADQQKVEIMRAIARDARLIVFDEPTASLSREESEQLFEIVRNLRNSGTTVVYVSHFLQEIIDLSDAITVMKDGKVVRTADSRDETPSSLVTSMLGRELDMLFPTKQPPRGDAPVVLETRSLTRGRYVRDVSLHLRAGEILGLAGLVGSGRTELARLIFGADRADTGTVHVGGREVRAGGPRAAIGAGIAMLPESRKEHGLLLGRSVNDNVSLPFLRDVARCGVIDGRRERRQTQRLAREVGIRSLRADAPVRALSGGNQQKALLARWLFRRPRVLIVDEPTRGIDVGARLAIYELLTKLASDGLAVLVISSEVEEVLGLAHRVLVMRAGEVVAELGGETNEQQVMEAAFAAAKPEQVKAR